MSFEQGTTVQVADRHEPGTPALLPGQNMGVEQALIAEARARARRRRRKIALALAAAVAVLSAAGVLITLTVPGKPNKVDAIAPAVAPVIRTGTITGHLNACYALAFGPTVTPGTVIAVRGTVTWKPMGPGTWHGTVVARAHISDNDHQVFRFALPPGKYALIGRYDKNSYPGNTVGPVTEVSVIAGKTVHADLNSGCK